jgi:TatD DNase family protein
MSLIDIHCHLDMLEEGVEAALEHARKQGVEKLITIGTQPEDHTFVLEVSEKYDSYVYCTLGVHPHEAELWQASVGDFIRAHSRKKQVVAVGEIGLDYYYNKSPVDQQKKAFSEQLDLAAELNLPVEIHTRDAEKDTVDVLQAYKGRVSGVIHCFTGTQWLAEQCLDLGFNISFSGIVTFKNADDLRKTCVYVPLNRLHVETDAPFLAPVPMRGKKNTPAFVAHTAEFVAKLKNVSTSDLHAQTGANARHVFKKLV